MTQYNETEDKLSIVFDARLDSMHCATLEPELTEAIKNTQKQVEFDLAQVEFVASSFLRLCLASCQKVGVEKFSIIHISPNVKKVFKMVGMDALLKME